MKTSFEIPDELVREIKVLAAREGKKLKEIVTEALQGRLAASSTRERHSLREIRPMRVGGPIKPRQQDDDLMGEMLDGRRG